MLCVMDPPETFVGKVVLVEAEAKDGSHEKLWVRVEGVTDTNGDALLHGTILLNPKQATYLKQGDRVEFTLDEIEQIHE